MPRLQTHGLEAQVAQARRQFLEQFWRAGYLLAGQPDPVLFRGRLRHRHFPLVDRALKQQPRSHLHKAGRQAHAFAGIGHCCGAAQLARFLAARPVKIAGRFFDQRHALFEQSFEAVGGGKLFERRKLRSVSKIHARKDRAWMNRSEKS